MRPRATGTILRGLLAPCPIARHSKPRITAPAWRGREGASEKTRKYMLMFWVDESGEVTADDDAAMMIAVKSWVEEMSGRGVRVSGGPLRPAAEARIVRVAEGELLVADGPF